MARGLRSPIARRNSQLVPKVRHEPALSQPLCERIDQGWRKIQSLCAIWVLRDDKLVPWQRLSTNDLAQVVSKVLDWRRAAGLGRKMHDIEPPAAILTTAMLAHEAVKPTLQAAREIEIPAVNRQHERIVQDARVEPIRQDQFNSSGVAVRIGGLFPFINPGEAMPSSF